MQTLLQISWRVSQWKNYENRPTFDEVIVKVKRGTFFETQCICKSYYISIQYSAAAYSIKRASHALFGINRVGNAKQSPRDHMWIFLWRLVKPLRWGVAFLIERHCSVLKSILSSIMVEQGLASHQTHHIQRPGHRGRVFTGKMTQPTVSQHWRTMGPKD